jgi:hypothetical protein
MNMNASSIIQTIILILIPLASATIYAEPVVHEHKAHTHGISEIELIISTETISIKFESPANNIVGFEHAASNAEEENQIKRAHSILSKPASIFSFQGAHCTSIPSSVNINGLAKKPHEHQTADKHQPHSTHKEITAEYQFQCKSSEDLTYIKTQLFNKFPNINEINVMWISDTNQGMSVLSPNNPQLSVE